MAVRAAVGKTWWTWLWVVEGMCVFGAVDGRLACFNLNRSCPRVLLVLWNRIDGAACWESVFALSWGGVQVSVY